MKQYTAHYTSQASLAVLGQWPVYQQAWKIVEQHVHIPQKTVRYRPIDKLQDVFLHILCGGQGLVEVNTGLRSQVGLQRAFGRSACAEQSTLARTLEACTPAVVLQFRQALTQVFAQYSRTRHHPFEQEYLLLDVDLTGMPAGRQGEGVTKGFFSEHKYRRGRQLGRVLASQYDEIVVEQLYPGTVQLEQSLQELMVAAEEVLQLSPEQRQRTVIRLDGGAGDDKDINWLLERGYRVQVKVKNGQRSRKLAQSVSEWQVDPKVPSREAGWVSQPHVYVRPTRQLAIRSADEQGQYRYRVLVFNLEEDELNWLAGSAGLAGQWAALQAYDRRGGGVETSNKNSKGGLGLTRRNKKKWAAQEMLVLLAELAYNLLAWMRTCLVQQAPRFARYGMLRLIRDVLGIGGKVYTNREGRVGQIVLNQAHGLAALFRQAFIPTLARDDLTLILRKI